MGDVKKEFAGNYSYSHLLGGNRTGGPAAKLGELRLSAFGYNQELTQYVDYGDISDMQIDGEDYAATASAIGKSVPVQQTPLDPFEEIQAREYDKAHGVADMRNLDAEDEKAAAKKTKQEDEFNAQQDKNAEDIIIDTEAVDLEVLAKQEDEQFKETNEKEAAAEALVRPMQVDPEHNEGVTDELSKERGVKEVTANLKDDQSAKNDHTVPSVDEAMAAKIIEKSVADSATQTYADVHSESHNSFATRVGAQTGLDPQPTPDTVGGGFRAPKPIKRNRTDTTPNGLTEVDFDVLKVDENNQFLKTYSVSNAAPPVTGVAEGAEGNSGRVFRKGRTSVTYTREKEQPQLTGEGIQNLMQRPIDMPKTFTFSEHYGKGKSRVPSNLGERTEIKTPVLDESKPEEDYIDVAEFFEGFEFKLEMSKDYDLPGKRRDRFKGFYTEFDRNPRPKKIY
jgi:hypothetical protein